MRNTADTMPYRLLSKQEVAEILGYTVRTIDRLIATHQIPFTRLPCGSGKTQKVRFDSRDIDAWIDGGKVVAVAGEGN